MTARCWVTRDEEPDGPMCAALRECAQVPVHEPVLERIALNDAAEYLRDLTPDDWLILTSPFAIESVNVELARVPRVAVVGEPSAELARSNGFRVELIASKGTGESLFAELGDLAQGRRVLYPRSSLAKPPDKSSDAAAGYELIAPVLYETRARLFDASVIERIDVITLTSASAVRAVHHVLPINTIEKLLASIGPSTSREIKGCGGRVWIEPPQPGLETLARAIADNYQRTLS